MNRLIIDITELINLQGKLTGVPRVINELSIRMVNEKNVYFVGWSSLNHEYYSVDPVFYLQRNKASRKNIPNKHPSTQFIKRLVRKSAITSKLTEIAIRRINNIKIKTKEKKLKTFLLEKSDKLIIMADWHSSDPSFIEYIKKINSSGVKLVQFVYDLLPIITPQYSGHSTSFVSKYAYEVYPLCKSIICISKNTKRDLQNYLQKNNLHEPNIEVIRLGDDFDMSKPIKPKDKILVKKKIISKDYILCVGTVEIRKNHMLLYYTYKLAKERSVVLPKIIIVGRLGWMSEAVYEIISNDSDVNDNLIFLNDVNDNELSWLYENCLFSIYPSFYEGWGLPVAESLSRGVPCVCSKSSSLTEIAGGLITYFSPYSPEECMNSIFKLQQPKELNTARKRIHEYKFNSWQNTFISVKVIIENI